MEGEASPEVPGTALYTDTRQLPGMPTQAAP